MTGRRVMAIVTAFRPSDGIVGNVSRIASQVDAVVVVDDGSGPGFDRLFGELVSNGVSVVRRSHNSGIAAALNAGVEAAAPRAEDLLVTFDQDSRVPDAFVAALVNRWDALTCEARRVGSVSPARFAGELQAVGERAREPIQSGTLYSGAVLACAGPFREEFFIDLVDADYWFRIRSLGFETFAVVDLDLPHELGRSYPLSVFGMRVRLRGQALTTSLSSPFRYYYRARNRVALAEMFGSTERSQLARDAAKWFIHLVLVLAFARPRGDMLRLLAAGRRAGRRRRMGRIPEPAQLLASRISWRVSPVEQSSSDRSGAQSESDR
ncbi:hypothetical protein GCM10028798_25420 [Humibacter antri]